MAFLGKSQEEMDNQIAEAVLAARHEKDREIAELKKTFFLLERKIKETQVTRVGDEREKLEKQERADEFALLKKQNETLVSRLDEVQDEVDGWKERAQMSERKATELKNTLARYLSRENGEQAKERYHTPFNVHYREQKDGAMVLYDIHLPVPEGRENIISAANQADEYQEKREESGEYKLKRVDLWGVNGEYVARFIEKLRDDEPF
jgi:hypothetical protein